MPQPVTPKWILTSPTRGLQYDPFEHAYQMGIKVIYRDLKLSNEMWLPQYRTIVLKESMRDAHCRTACTHGLGHAALGHVDDRPKHEVQADRWAADQLIDFEELSALSLGVPDLPRLAAELGVTNRILRVYLNVHRLAG